MDYRQTHTLLLTALLSGLSFLASHLFLPTSVASVQASIIQLDLFGPLLRVWNWIALVALMLWGGGLVVEQLVQARKDSSQFFDVAGGRIRSLQESCLWTLLIDEVVTFVLHVIQSLQPPSGQSFSLAIVLQFGGTTTYGRVWLVRVVLITLALVLQRWRQLAQRQGKAAGLPTRTTTGLPHTLSSRAHHLPAWKRAFSGRKQAAAAPVPTAMTHASLLLLSLLGGITLTYAAAGDFTPFPSLHLNTLVIGWFTLVAQCIWFGGLVCLGAVLLPDMESEWDEYVIALIGILRRATPLLVSTIGVTLVGTLFFSETSVSGAANGVDFFLSNPYGRTLLVELMLFAPLVILSLYALLMPHVKVQRRTIAGKRSIDKQVALEQAERSLRRPTRLFLWVAGSILLCSELLSFFPHPPSCSPGTAGTAAATIVSSCAGGAASQQPSPTQSIVTPTIVQPPAIATTINTARKQLYLFSKKDAGLMQPAMDRQGNLWVGEMYANRLGRFDSHTGAVEHWQVPNGKYGIMMTTIDARGNVWFVEQDADYIGRFDPHTQAFRIFPLGKLNGRQLGPQDLQFDAHGILWFTAPAGGGIGRLDPQTGALHIWPVPALTQTPSDPYSLALAPDGQVWFGELSGGAIGHLDPATGHITLYRLSNTQAQVFSMAIDSLGRIWFTELSSGKLGVFNPTTTTLSELPVPTVGNGTPLPYALVVTHDNAVWFVDNGDGALVRYQPDAHRYTFYLLALSEGAPYGIALDQQNKLWFTADSSSTDYVGVMNT
jgi:virginiamycin B lyase